MGEAVAKFVRPRFDRAVNNSRQGRPRRRAQRRAQRAGRGAWRRSIPTARKEIGSFFDKELKRYVRTQILEKGVRPDGRGTKEIRPIWCETGLLPRDARLGDLHARPDAGAQHRDARLARRGADDRWPGPGGVQALHPPLQLPAVQRRRDALLARPGAARDRPWRAGRARAGPGDPRARTSSPTRSASSPRCSARTARPRWVRPAAAPSR